MSFPILGFTDTQAVTEASMHIYTPPPPGEDTVIPRREALSARKGSCSLSFSGGLAARLPSLEAVHHEPNSQMAGHSCSLGRAQSSLVDGLLCSALPSQLFSFHSFTLRVIGFCSLTTGTPQNGKDVSKPEQNSYSGVRLESPFSLSFFHCLLTTAPTRRSFRSKNTRPAQKAIRAILWKYMHLKKSNLNGRRNCHSCYL